MNIIEQPTPSGTGEACLTGQPNTSNILTAFHIKELKEFTAKYLVSTNEERRSKAHTLQAAARAKVQHAARCEELAATGGRLTAAGHVINKQMSAISADVTERRKAQVDAIVAAAESGEKTFAKCIDRKLADRSAELQAVRLAALEIGERLIVHQREVTISEFEQYRIDGEHLGAMADVATLIAIDMSASAVAFQGSVVINPDAGRSGALRREAAILLTRYSQNKRDFDKREFERQSAA